MADHHPHHRHNRHQQHRPNRISVPPRNSSPSFPFTSRPPPSPYPLYNVQSVTTPTSTPSKHRLSSSTLSLSSSKPSSKKSSLSFLFLLFNLRSLYSLLPFLKSSRPSFSLFPFSFLLSLFSFLLTFSFSLIFQKPNQNQPIFALSQISPSQHRLLLLKSLVLSIVFVLRFQALKYCGAAAMILAELSGNVAARFLADSKNSNLGIKMSSSIYKVRGFFMLFIGLFLLSMSWDRMECFPFSASNLGKFGFTLTPKENCVRIWPMLLPFLSGFLSCYERVSMNWVTIRPLGRKRVRLITLFFTTIVLFLPALVSVMMFGLDGNGVFTGNLGWPLANTVLFGVLLSENHSDVSLASFKDYRREYAVTFVCTLVLELFYFPELSLWGLLLCGLLLWITVRELDSVHLRYVELGLESSESFVELIMKPIRHILSERKSRKIALFLLINTAYMVVEFVAGFMSNSLGLISDACHMLFDCAALAIGLYASYIARLPANGQFNYGRGRFEVLSGYVNAVFLVLVGSLIVVESFERILDPQEISTNSLLTVSIGGLVVNVVGLIFFHEEHHHAHGGSGSCSHSHSHSHLHSHSHSHSHPHSHSHDHHRGGCRHPHDHVGHDHKDHKDHNHHQDCISNTGVNRSEHHEHQVGHQHTDNSTDCLKFGSTEGHNHDHSHCEHSHQQILDHHDTHHHDHHHHQEHHHACEDVSVSTLRGSPHLFPEGHTGGNFHAQGVDANIHAHSSDLKSPSKDSGSQLGEVQLDAKPLGETKMHHHHHHIDHNMEGIFLHVLADTMGSVGVVISTLLIKYKGWLVADPASSIFISVLIVSSVFPLLRNSAEILLQRIPRAHELELKDALSDVVKIKGVRGIRNMHIWSFTNTDVVGTLHLHLSMETNKASVKAQVSHILHDAGVKDLTLQVEHVSTG